MSTLLGLVYNLTRALIGISAPTASVASANSTTFSNTMVTNVAGPIDPIYFLGAKCVTMFGTLSLMDGGGIAHSVGSYNGNLIFSFTACRDILPDPDFYRDCITQVIENIIDAAGQSSNRPRPRRVWRQAT